MAQRKRVACLQRLGSIYAAEEHPLQKVAGTAALVGMCALLLGAEGAVALEVIAVLQHLPPLVQRGLRWASIRRLWRGMATNQNKYMHIYIHTNIVYNICVRLYMSWAKSGAAKVSSRT